MLSNIDELNTPEYEPIDYEEWFGVLDIPEEDKEKRVELAEEIDDTYYNFFALVATMIALKKYLDWDYLTEYIETRLDEVVDDYGYPYLNEYARASAENTVDVTLRHQGEEYYLSAERASMLAAEDAQTIANYTELQQAISEGKNVKIWKTKNDNKVRDSHEIVNGKRVGILKPFSVGQSLLQFPRDFENAVSMRDVARCRCCLRYDYDPKFEEISTDSLEKQESGDIMSDTKEKVASTTAKEDAEKPNVIIPGRKIVGYLLNPTAEHYDNFIEAGYSEEHPEILTADILKNFDMSKATGFEKKNEAIEFEQIMTLGVGKERTFLTAWRIDDFYGERVPRLITAYRIKPNV